MTLISERDLYDRAVIVGEDRLPVDVYRSIGAYELGSIDDRDLINSGFVPEEEVFSCWSGPMSRMLARHGKPARED